LFPQGGAVRAFTVKIATPQHKLLQRSKTCNSLSEGGQTAEALMLHVLYLVHDLADPAVRRRVLMLQAGGATVTLAGFRRSDNAFANVEGLIPIVLGTTRDGKFAQRLKAVAQAALSLAAKLRGVSRPDIIVGRNLEMLALANRANMLFGGYSPIVYECLDIHRLLLRSDTIGKALRRAERLLGRNAQLLLTSSPAFVENYFAPFGQIDTPVVVLENKVLSLAGELHEPAIPAAAPQSGSPWKIGWFGALRCRRSFELLGEFTRRMEGRFRVVLRGRPAYSEFDDFDGFVRAEPFVDFHGAYRNPEDLAEIYRNVHFSWAIDFFEEGMNSSWLLPNRLYEGCRHGAVPIAMRNVETGRFLAIRGIGALLAEPSADALVSLIGDMDAQTYRGLSGAVASQDPKSWICNGNDCRTLVSRFQALTNGSREAALLQAAA
jgi:succinoglycan biosynthesis protein ExoL